MRSHRRTLLDYFLQPRKRLYYESRGEKYKQLPGRMKTLSLPCIPEELESEIFLEQGASPLLMTTASAPILTDACLGAEHHLELEGLGNAVTGPSSELLHIEPEEAGYAGHSYMLRVLDHNAGERSAALDELFGDDTPAALPAELAPDLDMDTIRLMSYGGFGVVVPQNPDVAPESVSAPPPPSPKAQPAPAIHDVMTLIEVITHLEQQQAPPSPAQQTKLAMLVSAFVGGTWRNIGFVYSQALKQNLVKPALRSKLLQTLKLLALQLLRNLAGAAANSIASLAKPGSTVHSVSHLMALARRSIVHE